MGQAPPGDSYNDDGRGFPLVAGAGDMKAGRVVPTKYTTAPTKLSRPWDVIIGIRASIGMRAQSSEEVCLGRGVAALRPGPELDRGYLWHWVEASASRLAAKGRGATFLQVNRQDIAEMKIPVPPLGEQRRVAQMLDLASDVKSRRVMSLLQLDALIESVFASSFGDPDENPFGWEIGPVSSFVASFEGGRSFAGQDDQDAHAPYRVLRVSAVTSGVFRPAESRPVPRSYAPPERHRVRSGDLLISRANTSELVGAVALVDDAEDSLLLPDKIWRFVWREPDTAVPEFVWKLFRTRAVRGAISRRSTGTSGSMKNISAEKLMSIEVIRPPFDRQREFARLLRRTRKLRTIATRHLAEVEALFNSLQHRAFNGEP